MKTSLENLPSNLDHLLQGGHIMAPFVLQASLTLMPDHELVSIAESDVFVHWPDRNQEVLLSEMHLRLGYASWANSFPAKDEGDHDV